MAPDVYQQVGQNQRCKGEEEEEEEKREMTGQDKGWKIMDTMSQRRLKDKPMIHHSGTRTRKEREREMMIVVRWRPQLFKVTGGLR